MRVTLNVVNSAIAAAGIDAELVRGSGYFYFSGPAVESAYSSTVGGVYKIGSLTVDQWLNALRTIIEKGQC